MDSEDDQRSCDSTVKLCYEFHQTDDNDGSASLESTLSQHVQNIQDLRQQANNALVLMKTDAKSNHNGDDDGDDDTIVMAAQWDLEQLQFLTRLASSLEFIFDKGKHNIEPSSSGVAPTLMMNEIAESYCKIALVNICQWIISSNDSHLQHSEQFVAPPCDDNKSLDITKDESQTYLLSLAWSISQYLTKRQRQQKVDATYEDCTTDTCDKDHLDDYDDTSDSSAILAELCDSCLDWAIASKKAGQMSHCVAAHMIRMTLDSSYQVTDAVRLLGLQEEESEMLSILGNAKELDNFLFCQDDKDDMFFFFHKPLLQKKNTLMKVQEIEKHGIFEADMVALNNLKSAPNEMGDENTTTSKDITTFKYQPTQRGKTLGRKIRTIFAQFEYNFQNCRALLVPLISSVDGDKPKVENAAHPDRIFSANSFFQHRHEFAIYLKQKELSLSPAAELLLPGIEVLASLFLFGIALDVTTVETVLGSSVLQTMVESGLLTEPIFNFSKDIKDASTRRVIGTVQVFPISPTNDLHGFSPSPEGAQDCSSFEEINFGNCLIFITDWPMESLRMIRDAVMPVGEDTLELLALTAGAGECGSTSTYSRNNHVSEPLPHSSTTSTPSRILDLCCGCGIQGIFTAWCCYGNYDELVCTDINERACYFAVANIVLNFSGMQGYPAGQRNPSVSVIHGDLYDGVFKMLEQSQKNSRESIGLENSGYFDRIVSNPPFVAVPCPDSDDARQLPNNSPALYAAGGGADGMDILRRIVMDCPKVLLNQKSSNSSMLMVTEVPNIESSCSLLQGYLPEPCQRDDSMAIRIAYVGRDVETVEEYASVRESEVNTNVDPALAPPRYWASIQQQVGVHNRALALISIRYSKDNMDESSLFQFGEGLENDSDEEDYIEEEEDLFLTREGINFARSSCLS